MFTLCHQAGGNSSIANKLQNRIKTLARQSPIALFSPILKISTWSENLMSLILTMTIIIIISIIIAMIIIIITWCETWGCSWIRGCTSDSPLPAASSSCGTHRAVLLRSGHHVDDGGGGNGDDDGGDGDDDEHDNLEGVENSLKQSLTFSPLSVYMYYIYWIFKDGIINFLGRREK